MQWLIPAMPVSRVVRIFCMSWVAPTSSQAGTWSSSRASVAEIIEFIDARFNSKSTLEVVNDNIGSLVLLRPYN